VEDLARFGHSSCKELSTQPSARSWNGPREDSAQDEVATCSLNWHNGRETLSLQQS
jgi:hypothetical protein